MATPALGIFECRGQVAQAAAADALLKKTDVRLCGRHGIGSGWLTLLVEGETAQVQSAVETATASASEHGEVITATVLPRPEGAVHRMPHSEADTEKILHASALGFVETQGFTPLIPSADAMVKAADVELVGWTFIGGALVHVAVTGTVDDVEAAVAAGRKAAASRGVLHASLVLPQPESALGALLPPRRPVSAPCVGALGVVESTGYAGSVASADGMVKEAEVEISGITIGSGGRVATLIRGSLDVVQLAVEEGGRRAAEVAECNGHTVISGPDPQVLACFAYQNRLAPGAPSSGDQAMGIIETRSTAGLAKAVDDMLKNTDVRYGGRYKVGYFLTASVIRGDVAAVEEAIALGSQTAQRHGELVATHVIRLPFTELEQRLPHS
ncbi:MAG: BMC domain-containing protein [Candidatus Latescibacterota bacterium]|nr:BMC domain-containing protein [Candidatus Latescibacterota bacterium]